MLLSSAATGAAQAPASAAQADAVARVVQGIISYTYWPPPPHLLHFCIVGATPYRQQLLTRIRSMPGKPIRVRAIDSAQGASPSGCDILYYGAPAPAARRPTDPPALTISEVDRACRGGSMFCLKIDPHGVSFDLNLDAVTRSGLRVDPKVLMLGHMGGAA